MGNERDQSRLEGRTTEHGESEDTVQRSPESRRRLREAQRLAGLAAIRRIGEEATRSPANSGSPAREAASVAKLERAFGTSFDDVTIVPDSPRAGGSVHALTEGNEIHFAPGRHRPGTEEGDRLLAHELAHVVQQRGGPSTTQSFDGRSASGSGKAIDSRSTARFRRPRSWTANHCRSP